MLLLRLIRICIPWPAVFTEIPEGAQQRDQLQESMNISDQNSAVHSHGTSASFTDLLMQTHLHSLLLSPLLYPLPSGERAG